MDTLIPIISWSAATIIFECIMWHIFFRKTVQICFLNEPDLLFSRFCTIGALRIIVLLHTVFLITVIILSYSFLW